MKTRTSMTPTLVLGAGTLATAAFLALAGLWALDRAHPREAPRWEPARFPALHAAPGAAEGWREHWVVAVHPGCPHCRVSLSVLAAARDRSRAAVHVTALLVDVPEPPGDGLAAMPADEVHWDAEGCWRQRWRHRVYGETFCFDSTGTLIRSLAPFARVEEALEALGAFQLTGVL
jgi:hypothetical protein